MATLRGMVERAPVTAGSKNPGAPWEGRGRFDMVWVFDRQASGWTFSQVPQMVLAGDSPIPIQKTGR